MPPFKSFSQVDASTTRKFGGYGPGVGNFATVSPDDEFGQIGVESELGRVAPSGSWRGFQYPSPRNIPSGRCGEYPEPMAIGITMSALPFQ